MEPDIGVCRAWREFGHGLIGVRLYARAWGDGENGAPAVRPGFAGFRV